jgi:protein phosphatase
MCLDTGCVFGGKLTALRYPSREVVSVPAEKVWYEPAKPFLVPAPVRSAHDLAITDVLGKRGVETRIAGRVTVREDNAAGALEVMSRWALEPSWLLYLPPTMAPCATSPDGDLLEHPLAAFDAYRSGGVGEVICEEKHMGSRAVALICTSAEVAARRFGAADGQTGVVYTRTGRSFFGNELTESLLKRLRAAVDAAGLWAELGTDWLLLDCELLPWSAKAEELLRAQYAAVGAAAGAVLPAAVEVLARSARRGADVDDLQLRTDARTANAAAFIEAYRRYVWPTSGLDGVQIAPFQLLASEGQTWADRDHGWHLAMADRLVAADPQLVRPTRRLVVDLADNTTVTAGVEWWMALTGAGGEGMVVKPLANLTRTSRGWPQPGIKVRGREYLRIIYGPDYTLATNLDRLRSRNLGHKRSLAAREYALGIESLERAVAGEPLWRVHEPVFAVLALESEPVDPRL